MRLPLFAVCMLLPLSAFGFDFKGIKIGALATPEQVQEKLGVKCGAGANAAQVCNGTVTIARETARLNLVINSAGVVQRMHLMLSPEAFDIVAPMLISKFGPPTKTSHSQIQNRMGAKFDQVRYWWQGEGDTEVDYSRYTGTLDSSTLYFSTKEDRELLGKLKGNRAGDI